MSNLDTRAIYCPGHLWINCTAGAINMASYPDNITGTFLGETAEPVVMVYNPLKIGLVIDKYGDLVIDYRDIGAELYFNIKLAEWSIDAKKLFFGNDRVTSGGGVQLPGPDASNIALSAPTNSILFITQASINAKTTQEAYKMNFFLPKVQAMPPDNTEILFGNVFQPVDIDLRAMYKESAVAGNQPFRLAKFDTIANITVF